MHVHNVDAVMQCVLPYHETPFFARILQCLVLDGTSWEFLKPAAKAGAVVPRSLLVDRAASHTAVLDFVGSAAAASYKAKVYCKNTFALYAAVFVQALARGATSGS